MRPLPDGGSVVSESPRVQYFRGQDTCLRGMVLRTRDDGSPGPALLPRRGRRGLDHARRRGRASRPAVAVAPDPEPRGVPRPRTFRSLGRPSPAHPGGPPARSDGARHRRPDRRRGGRDAGPGGEPGERSQRGRAADHHRRRDRALPGDAGPGGAQGDRSGRGVARGVPDRALRRRGPRASRSDRPRASSSRCPSPGSPSSRRCRPGIAGPAAHGSGWRSW